MTWPDFTLLRPLLLPIGIPTVAALVMSMVQAFLPSPVLRANPEVSSVERRGYEVFRREGCYFSCHAMGALVTASNGIRPVSIGNPPDLRLTPRRRLDWHVAHLVDPPAVLGGSAMPSFVHLSTEDLEALIAFLQRLNEGVEPEQQPTVSPESIPDTPLDLAGYRAGRAVYRLHCAGCHGGGGNGAGRVGHVLTPEPRDFTDAVWMSKQTDVYLFSIITNGKPDTAMPPYRDRLSARDIALAMRYVRYFADPVAQERMEVGFLLD